MKIKTITLPLFLFLVLIGAGILIIVLSFFSDCNTYIKPHGLRAIGFICLFLGLGEYLNHPLQKKLIPSDQDDSGVQEKLHRTRNPCGLGNTLDVLALVCLFIAVSLLFFPYEP